MRPIPPLAAKRADFLGPGNESFAKGYWTQVQSPVVESGPAVVEKAIEAIFWGHEYMRSYAPRRAHTAVPHY